MTRPTVEQAAKDVVNFIVYCGIIKYNQTHIHNLQLLFTHLMTYNGLTIPEIGELIRQTNGKRAFQYLISVEGNTVKVM